MKAAGLVALAGLILAHPGPVPTAPTGSAVQRVPVNPGYGASFVFTRIRYFSSIQFGFGRGGAAWAHDYPRADSNLSTLIAELTTIDTETDGTNVFDLDDPELFKYPIAYISEPGFWDMTDGQAASSSRTTTRPSACSRSSTTTTTSRSARPPTW